MKHRWGMIFMAVAALLLLCACTDGSVDMLQTAGLSEQSPSATAAPEEPKDKTPPKAVVSTLDLYEADELVPEDFIVSITDENEVSIEFIEPIDYQTTTWQSVGLLLEDSAGNQAVYVTKLRISKVIEKIACELDQGVPDVASFLKTSEDKDNASYLTEPVAMEPGNVSVQIEIGGDIYESELLYVDSMAPQAIAVTGSVYVGEIIEPEELLFDIKETTPVTCEYVTEPDFTKEGVCAVSIRLSDSSENTSILKTEVTVLKDTKAPVLFGVEDIVANAGEPAKYLSNVTAIDDKDGEVSVAVDSSRVNIRQTGEYPIVYSASDLSGNVVTGGALVIVVTSASDYDELQEKLLEVAGKIFRDDMTSLEKARAVYDYVLPFTYTGISDKSNWIKEALSGLTKQCGDCYTSYIISKLLLDQAGIPNLDVVRLSYEGESNHYWLLVNCGDGWYHFDASAHSHLYPFESFMVTDSEIAAYSELRGGDGYYYRYDKSLYDVTIVP